MYSLWTFISDGVSFIFSPVKIKSHFFPIESYAHKEGYLPPMVTAVWVTFHSYISIVPGSRDETNTA